jgi:hypothetical protein
MTEYHLIQDVYSFQSLYLLAQFLSSLSLRQLISDFYSHLIGPVQNVSANSQRIFLLVLPNNEAVQV